MTTETLSNSKVTLLEHKEELALSAKLQPLPLAPMALLQLEGWLSVLTPEHLGWGGPWLCVGRATRIPQRLE